MDKIDLKLLSLLREDSKQSLRELAKQVGLSKTATQYRVKKLEESVITKYVVITQRPIMYARFTFEVQTSQDHFEETIEKLKSFPKTVWLATSAGKANITIAFGLQSFEELFSLKEELEIMLDGILLNQEFSVARRIYYCTPTIFGLSRVPSVLVDYNQVQQLSSFEDKLLSLLEKDPKISVVDMCSELSCSVSTVMSHLKSLKKRDMLKRYSIDLDLSYFGYDVCHIFWKTNRLDASIISQMKTFFLEQPEVLYITEALGPAPIESEIIIKNQQELYAFISKVKETFPDLISSYELLYMLQVH